MTYDPFNRGERPVGVRTIETTNEPRSGRQVTVEVWYPATAEYRGKDTNESTFDRFTVGAGLPEQSQEAVRDARIAQIYEGTNGVQAMDLVGRKLAKDGGRGVRALFDAIARDIEAARAAGDPAGIAEPLEAAVGHLQGATMWLAQHGMADPNNAGAGAYAYMQLMGLVSLGWMWAKMATVSAGLRNQDGEDKSFHETKIATARYYATRELVAASTLRKKVEAGAESLMALPVEAF